MARITVSIDASNLLQLLDSPALLTKQVRLGTYVVDAVVVDAHPDIARLYGFTAPSQIRGLYLSQLHDRDCLARVRRYSVARLLGLSGVPESYDMCVRLPNGGSRWLRKERVRVIREGDDVYWLSQSRPIESDRVQRLPDISLPLSEQELRQIAGWGTVADLEALIQNRRNGSQRDSVRSRSASTHPLSAALEQMSAQNPMLQQATIAHAMQSGLMTSFELPFDDPEYRRWVHRCGRCQRWWVADLPKPIKCNHCKSPYWNRSRVRNRGGRVV